MKNFALCKISLIFFSSLSFSFEKISLPPVDCSESSIIGSNVGLRPYRTGGIRLESESIGNKKIFHNYGHGGAGATLAPGCVERIVSLFNQEDLETTSTRVSIIGSGFIGLMTANQLADRGCKVTLYADQFPEKDYFYSVNKKACLTSLVGGGLWLPFGVDTGENLNEFRILQSSSYNFYRQNIENFTSKGVSFRDVYTFPSQDTNFFPLDLEKPQLVEVEFGNKRYFPASRWSTIHIDNRIVIDELYAAAQRKNVIFKEKKLQNIDDVLGLSDIYIFNCSGYGSKTIFNDEDMKAIRGQLLYLKPQSSINFFMFNKEKEQEFAIYPSSDKISIGYTYEEGNEILETNYDQLKKIRQNVDSFFSNKKI